MSSTSSSNDARRRVAFKLVQDEDGYPPADWEHLWVRQVGDVQYEIDSIPFFVPGVSVGDIVEAQALSGELQFVKAVLHSKNSTIRVIVDDAATVTGLRDSLQRLGCDSEVSHISSLIAVNVPEGVALAAVRRFLDTGEREGRWEYEESSLRTR